MAKKMLISLAVIILSFCCGVCFAADNNSNVDLGNEITDSNKATGALLKGRALCSGYTDAFAIFLDKLKIPNFKINSEEHEWNAIYFNKKWTHIDLTWDDDEINKNNNRNFFMVNTKELQEKDKKEHNFKKALYYF